MGSSPATCNPQIESYTAGHKCRLDRAYPPAKQSTMRSSDQSQGAAYRTYCRPQTIGSSQRPEGGRKACLLEVQPRTSWQNTGYVLTYPWGPSVLRVICVTIKQSYNRGSSGQHAPRLHPRHRPSSSGAIAPSGPGPTIGECQTASTVRPTGVTRI